MCYSRELLIACSKPRVEAATLDLSFLRNPLFRDLRPRKRGRRGGVRIRNRRRRYKLPLPSIVLGNAQSLGNKCDELIACCQASVSDPVMEAQCISVVVDVFSRPIPPTSTGKVSVDKRQSLHKRHSPPHLPDSGRTQASNIIAINTQQLKSSMTVGVFNAQSVGDRKKRTKIVEFVRDENIDVLFLTETWLKTSGDESKCADLVPPGYKLRSFPRATTGGGIAVLYRDHLPVTVTTSFPFTHTTFELVQFTLTAPQHIHFFCLYRPPPSKKNKLLASTFVAELPDFLDYCNLLRAKSVVVGDFNVHYDVPTNPLTSKVIDILSQFDFVQGVQKTTFYRSRHILDWIVYREADHLVQSCSVSHTISSDHAATVCSLNVSCPQKQPTFRTVRDIKTIDMDAFRADIRQMLDDLGPDLTAQHLDDGLKALLDKHAPATERRVPSCRTSPWYAAVSDRLREAKRERRRAERRWRKSGLTVDQQIFWAAKQTVIDIVQAAKEEYWSSKIESSASVKHFFSTADQLLGRKKDTTLPSNIPSEGLSDAFSEFFENKIRTIRDELDSSSQSVPSPLSVDQPHLSTSFDSFRPVSEDEVKRVILKSSPKTCALDPIPTSLLVECVDVLLPALTSVINSSLQSGTFPDLFKQALVTPLLKKPSLDANCLKNYRPVSNLSFLSKITEKIVLSQLSEYLHSNNLFPSSQSAYRPAHSTETALLRVINDLLQAMDKGKLSLLTLLDLSAAFDTIDHTILLHRLSFSFGISGSALNWFSSYLSNRTQTVTACSHHSKPSALHFGVPQGSVLGPVLFILYTKPLSSITQQHSILSQYFADDSQLYDSCSPDQLQDTTHRIQNCITNIKQWMTSNKLKLNDDKTEVLLIKPQNKQLPLPAPSSFSVGSSDIQFSTSARNLGVTITDTLSMEKHITNICRSAYLELRKISSIRHLLTLEATKTLVCTLVLSKFDYCNSLLCNVPKKFIDKLQRVQNSAAKLVFRAKKYDHIQPFLHNLHWLPISSRIQHKVSNLCFNSFINPHFPVYLSEVLHVYNPVRQLRSSTDTRTLCVPRTKTKTFGDRSFAHSAPAIWNQLPSTIRHSTSSSQFRTSLKTHLFRTVYSLG